MVLIAATHHVGVGVAGGFLRALLGRAYLGPCELLLSLLSGQFLLLLTLCSGHYLDLLVHLILIG